MLHIHAFFKMAVVIAPSLKKKTLCNFSYTGGGKYPSPSSYICKGCGQSGHHIRACPNKPEILGPHIKRPTGIPQSFLTVVDDPLTPGALLTTRGHFAVPTLDA
jgi:hypothetical protein